MLNDDSQFRFFHYEVAFCSFLVNFTWFWLFKEFNENMLHVDDLFLFYFDVHSKIL